MIIRENSIILYIGGMSWGRERGKHHEPKTKQLVVVVDEGSRLWEELTQWQLLPSGSNNNMGTWAPTQNFFCLRTTLRMQRELYPYDTELNSKSLFLRKEQADSFVYFLPQRATWVRSERWPSKGSQAVKGLKPLSVYLWKSTSSPTDHETSN